LTFALLWVFTLVLARVLAVALARSLAFSALSVALALEASFATLLVCVFFLAPAFAFDIGLLTAFAPALASLLTNFGQTSLDNNAARESSTSINSRMKARTFPGVGAKSYNKNK
jgi:hypothetical protein